MREGEARLPGESSAEEGAEAESGAEGGAERRSGARTGRERWAGGDARDGGCIIVARRWRRRRLIHSVHPTQCLSVDSTTRQLEFNINTDYFDFEANTRKALKPKFDANGVDDAGTLLLIFQQ